jgi:hypothetical protein
MPLAHSSWEFYSLLAILCANVFVQVYQIKNINIIKSQTNGLINHTINAIREHMILLGEKAGTEKEQSRIAAKTALADEVAFRLAEAKKSEQDKN